MVPAMRGTSARPAEMVRHSVGPNHDQRDLLRGSFGVSLTVIRPSSRSRYCVDLPTGAYGHQNEQTVAPPSMRPVRSPSTAWPGKSNQGWPILISEKFLALWPMPGADSRPLKTGTATFGKPAFIDGALGLRPVSTCYQTFSRSSVRAVDHSWICADNLRTMVARGTPVRARPRAPAMVSRATAMLPSITAGITRARSQFFFMD